MQIGGSSVGQRGVRNSAAAMLVATAAAGLTVGTLMSGCAAKQTASTDGNNAAVTRPAYDPAKLEAKRAAERRYNASVGRDRDAAALAVGLICKDMGDASGARQWLSPLVSNPDPQIAGRAQATLGLMAQERGDHSLAIELLRAAAEKLRGDDAVQARLATARSLDALGRAQEAKAEYARASVMGGYSDPPALASGTSATIVGTSTSGNFAIQVGAFASKANADRQAAMIQRSAVDAGLGMPWIEPQTDSSGKPLYAVRVGKFGSRAAAVDARSRAGLRGIIASVD